MTIQESVDLTGQTPPASRAVPPVAPTAAPPSAGERIISVAGTRALAVLRIAVGFVFLWAFVDKFFGLHYSTASANAWINGGSPTKGFLSGVAVGPFESLFHSFAGATWANWLFMAGLLGIGVAMMAGIAMRIAAASGVLLLAFMWIAAYPLAQFTSAGAATRSTNPFVDDHLINAIVLVVVALCGAGATWGFGKVWAKIPFVERHSWAR